MVVPFGGERAPLAMGIILGEQPSRRWRDPRSPATGFPLGTACATLRADVRLPNHRGSPLVDGDLPLSRRHANLSPARLAGAGVWTINGGCCSGHWFQPPIW